MKTNLTEEQLAKLPAYVRNEIERLVADGSSMERALRAGAEDSNTFLEPYNPQTRRPLGKDPVILFRTGDGMKGFTVQFKNEELLVQGMAPSYEDHLAVFPMSGNYVAIKHVKRES